MIKDSGNRREFETGAVRDIQEGKGRCDLLPLDVVAALYNNNKHTSGVFHCIKAFQDTGDCCLLFGALNWFVCDDRADTNTPTMLLELSIHFEEGAKKYGENNWQKGIPRPRRSRASVEGGARR